MKGLPGKRQQLCHLAFATETPQMFIAGISDPPLNGFPSEMPEKTQVFMDFLGLLREQVEIFEEFRNR